MKITFLSTCGLILDSSNAERLKKYSFIVVLSFALFLFTFSAGAQTPAQLFKAGNESLSKGEFYTAASYLKQALDKDDDQATIWFSYAEACRQFNDYSNAAKGYRGCIERDKQNEFPMAKFWLGVMLQNGGNYEEAIVLLNEFKTFYRKKDFYSQKVQQLIESCAWALANHSVNERISVVHLGDNINTTFSEINPILHADSLKHYASTKPAKGNTFRTQIFNASNGEVFLPGVEEGTAKHIANGCYSWHNQFGEEFFFTQCGMESGNTRCEIYVSKLEGNQWRKAKPLTVNVNLSGHTATHPAVANDENGNQWLIFSSNRPGGKGKMDIWLSRRLSETEWDYPQNAGSLINSADDEVTPFFDVNSNSLFFSSNWHYGFGGFDVFQAKLKSLSNAAFEKPKNLGLPLNSPANDLYYVAASSTAYFSSNRKGSKFIEAETCCNDIYSVTYTSQKEEVAFKQTEMKIKDSLKIKTAEQSNKEVPFKPEAPAQPEKSAELSFSRQTSLAEFSLPIMLYFHNDEPNPKTMLDHTDVNYLETYQTYINLQKQYENEYVKGALGAEKQFARSHINSWFSDTVEFNLKKLIHFSALLLSELEAGRKLHVTVSGYCSPLNFNQYNIHLGNRRVSSVLNFFRSWRNGILLSYLNDGKLLFVQVSEGEEKAPATVSDSVDDLRNSVYSPAAARERRVEIRSVKVE